MKDLIEVKMVSDDDSSILNNTDHYPYGTSIELSDDMIDELKLSEAEVGDEMMMHGMVKVVSKSDHSNENNSSKSLSFQFIEIGVKNDDNLNDDIASKLYE